MPDWSYRTFLRPLLFRQPAETARDFTLSAMGKLASLPLGPKVVNLMGYMTPPASVARSAVGITFPGPVGLSAGLDPHFVGIKALSQFGFGFIEVGPVTRVPVTSDDKVERLIDQRAICYPAAPVNDGLDQLVAQLEKAGKLPIPLGIRLPYVPNAAAEQCHIIERLAKFAAFYSVEVPPMADGEDQAWIDHLAMLVKTAMPNPVLLCLSPDLPEGEAGRLVSTVLATGIAGIMITDEQRDSAGRRVVGPMASSACLSLLQALRSQFGDDFPIFVSGGITEPAGALKFLDAGATMVQINSGLVYAGPGLPKRINEAVAYYGPCKAAPTEPPRMPGYIPRWAWIALLGLILIVSALVAWEVAVTSVVLPYDEAFLGISRAKMILINDRLLPFMAHDRVTLVGTMIATGVVYVGLALFGIRRGMSWAREAFLVSCLAGFLGFFLFLGFGYFDPLHAVLTLMLVPLFIMGVSAKLSPALYGMPNLTEHRTWRRAQWGQLIFIVIGIGLLLAGFAIIFVGLKDTFVPEDLQFLKTSADVLRAANPHLLPLIAHDRVGFGGNLVANGILIMLVSLWGFREGARWLWWTLLMAGVPGFVAALGIHLVVGYENLWHLFPAILALVLFVSGIILSWSYLWHAPEPYRTSTN